MGNKFTINYHINNPAKMEEGVIRHEDPLVMMEEGRVFEEVKDIIVRKEMTAILEEWWNEKSANFIVDKKEYMFEVLYG